MPLLRAGSGFLGGGRLPVPVPTLGAELIQNGDFDSATGWTLDANWSIGSGVLTGSNVTGYAYQSALTVGAWYLAAFTILTFTGGIARARFGATLTPDRTAPGTYYNTGLATTTQLARIQGASSFAGTIDNVSFRAITLSSMFSTRPYTTHRVTKAKATVVSGTRSGVVANLDSASSPANFVIASHDSVTCRLTKCVAGTYTELISTAVAYSAGAFVEIRRLAGTDTFRLFYNGSQVGTDQTISDAGITSNTLHGYFNSFAGNTLSDFSCVASV